MNRSRRVFGQPAFAALLAFAAGPVTGAVAEQPAPTLGLPVACRLGTECFVQQLPDMDGGPAAADPFCGGASYDGHDGIDIRIGSLRDIARGVPVVAAAAGTVRGVRDGMPDAIVDDEATRRAVNGVECGNGVVLDHGGGWETQYCHMRRTSVAVKSGDRVERGARLGEIGSSGLAQFPHVHLSVRRSGEKLDPVSGRPVGGGCAGPGATAGTLFAPDAAAALSTERTAILDAGMADAPVDYDRLVREGAPPVPAAGGATSLVWGWFINLREGDRIAFRMLTPDGATFFETLGEPLEGNKASYSAFAGRKRPLTPGSWTVKTGVVRAGVQILSTTRQVAIPG